MDILLRGSTPDLARWESRAFADTVALGPRPTDRQDVYRRVIAAEPAGAPEGPFRRAADAILRYDIFPPEQVAPLLRRAPVQVGDTVGIRFFGLPFVQLFFAARVCAVFDAVDPATGVRRVGFTYRTLQGHPELGEETFAVEKHPDGVIYASLSSWSRDGTWLASVFAPKVRGWQVRASRAALDHLAALGRG